MLIARGCTSVVLGLFAALLGLVFLIDVVAGESSINHTIKNNETIESDFQLAATFVEKFRHEHARFPTSAEFEAQFRGGQYPVYVEMAGFSPGATELFGAPPRDAFVLTIWRGEWMEYYASWTKMSFRNEESIAVLPTGLAVGRSNRHGCVDLHSPHDCSNDLAREEGSRLANDRSRLTLVVAADDDDPTLGVSPVGLPSLATVSHPPV